MKKQALEIVDLQFKLKLKLLDEVLEKIWDYRKEWLTYLEIAKKMWVDSRRISLLVNHNIEFIEWLKNSTLANWLHNLTK